MTDDVLPQDGAPPSSGRRGGFLRRNLFLIWGVLMLVGGIARLILDRDGTGFIGVGLGMAFVLTDGVSRRATELFGPKPKK